MKRITVTVLDSLLLSPTPKKRPLPPSEERVALTGPVDRAAKSASDLPVGFDPVEEAR